jgi:transcriptional regulator with XRE-family HTH domain
MSDNDDKKTAEKDFYIWVGKRLREMREKLGMKQRELAEKSGIKAPFLSKVENDGKKISAYQISKVLDAMGYNLTNF